MTALTRRRRLYPSLNRLAYLPALSIGLVVVSLGSGASPPPDNPPVSNQNPPVAPTPAVANANSNSTGSTLRPDARFLKPDIAPAQPVADVASPANAGSPATPADSAANAVTHSLSVLSRAYAQDQGAWNLDYRVRIDGPHGLILVPSDVSARVEGWVSNSRVSGHSAPRFSSATLSGPEAPAGFADLIKGSDESKNCRERLVVQVWPESNTPTPLPASQVSHRSPLSLAPGAVLCARIRLEHDHAIFGDYDPLLGLRTLELQLGPVSMRDSLPLDREQYLAQGKGNWSEPPPERRDARMFISRPDRISCFV